MLNPIGLRWFGHSAVIVSTLDAHWRTPIAKEPHTAVVNARVQGRSDLHGYLEMQTKSGSPQERFSNAFEDMGDTRSTEAVAADR